MVQSKSPTLCNICEVFLIDHRFSVAQYIPWLGCSFVQSRAKYQIRVCKKNKKIVAIIHDTHGNEEVDLICEGASKGVVDPPRTIGVVDVVTLSSCFKC